MASWYAESNSLMNCPSSINVRGIQICWPKHIVIRLASVDLPFPGLPYKNSPARELTAGPRTSSRAGFTEMSAKAAVNWARFGAL